MACDSCYKLQSNLDSVNADYQRYVVGNQEALDKKNAVIAGLRQELLEVEAECSALRGQLASKDQEIERLKKNIDLCMTRPQGWNTGRIGE